LIVKPSFKVIVAGDDYRGAAARLKLRASTQSSWEQI